MKKSLIYLRALMVFSIAMYASCSKSNETVTQSGLSPIYELQLPVHRMGVFYFNGNIGIIGYKTEDSTNIITNFDSTDFTFNDGDTLFICKNFSIHHDLTYPNAAYLTFEGTADCRNEKGDNIKIFGKFAMDLDYVKKGGTAIPPKKYKEKHECKSYEGFFDFVFMCNCCQIIYKENRPIGCDCICGFAGMCLHTKTIEMEKTGSGLDQNMSGSVYNRIMQK